MRGRRALLIAATLLVAACGEAGTDSLEAGAQVPTTPRFVDAGAVGDTGQVIAAEDMATATGEELQAPDPDVGARARSDTGEAPQEEDALSRSDLGDTATDKDTGPDPDVSAPGQSDAQGPTDTSSAEDSAESDALVDPGCEPSCAGKACGDDGCGGACGSCGDQESCQDGQCVCAPQCEGLQCGADGCGGVCGSCSEEESCQGGQCVCAPQCEGLQCGDDGCGGSCGGCGAQQSCQAGQCVCSPQCAGKECGDDGCGGSCGSCEGPESCQGGQCGCTPECAGKQCGDDGCGGSCGSCADQEVCLGDQCVCAPDCEGKSCGDDGCGGSCGSCEDNNPCTIDFCTDAQSCAASELALVPCDSPPCAVNDSCLYDLARSGLSTTERIVAISLQGILAQSRPAIWLGEGQSMPLHQARLEDDYGVSFVATDDLWDLVSRFNGALSGYVLYDPATSSQNVALSLAGVLGAVAISPDLEAQAQAQGLSLVQDVRGLDELWCWDTYAGQFAGDMLVEHSEDYGWGEWLLDFPIARRAFIYFDATCGDLRTQLASQLDAPLIYGWGAECGEYEFVKGASEGGASVVPSDYSSNLSVLSNVSGVPLTGNHHPPEVLETEDNVHYVAFVMSDGDNIQFLQNAFDDPRWWGSEHRGSFPMTWEVSPILPDPAPTILQWLYESATDNDQAVSGPSGAGYALPSMHTKLESLAEGTGQAMAQTDMRVMTLLNSGGGLEAGDAFTARPEIDGVIYKDFADYNALKGALRWSNGKPIMAFHYLLWNNGSAEDSPQGVAQSINSAPRDPKNNIASYSLVNVHAWSEWPESPTHTGAMGATAWTVSLLDAGVRVVSAEELFKHLSAHLAGETSPQSGGMVFEAESDLSHQMGYAEGDGWASNTADQSPGHMCYGPYTSVLGAGDYIAHFDLLVDVPGPPASNDLVVTLDVFDSQSGTYLAMRDVTRYEFDAPFVYKTFSLPFSNPAGSVLEFRVFWHGSSYVNVDKVSVE